MSWQRELVAQALAVILAEACPDASVFDHPPATVTPPAVVVSWPTTVTYNESGFGVDRAAMTVALVAPVDGEALIDSLKAAAREAILEDKTLAGSVASAVATGERNWRVVNVAGVDVLQAELELELIM
jgi:hypothetical protein